MKKVLFTTLSIIAVAAMMFVSCKKENGTDNGGENGQEQQQTVDPELVGTWTITGEAQGWAADGGVAMTESNNVWTAAEVAVKGEGFKFVKDGAWTINLGASPKTGSTQKFDDDVEFDLEKDGDNIAGAKDGIYSVTLNLLTKKAKIKFVKDLEPEGPQIPEGDHTAVGTWENVEGYVEYFRYYNIAADWSNAVLNNQRALAFDGISYENGVFTFVFPDQTFARWQNQLYINPVDNFAVGLEAGKYYKMSFKLNASAAHKAFFKLEVLNKANNAENKYEGALLHEVGEIEMTAGEDVPVEFTFESTAAVENIILVFDFGFNLANETVLLKNITLEEAEAPAKVLKITESIIPPAYPTINTVVSAASGEEFYVNNIANYSIKYPDTGGKIQMKGNVNSFFANRSSFGKIVSVKVTCQEGKDWYPNNLKMYAGSAELPAETEITGTSDSEAKTGTYDFSSGDYQYFTLKNTSKYAVYLQEIEITYTGAVTTPAFTLDGAFDEWTNIGAFTTTNERVTSWKAASDANNIYIYAVCPASVVKTRGIWNAYIDGAFDLDNNEETGDAASYSLGNGMEAAFVAFPFSNDAGADPTFVNGEKSDSWIKYPVSTAVGKVTSFGKVDGDNTLVELAIPRNLIGNPASGATIAINIGMGTSPVGKQTLILK